METERMEYLGNPYKCNHKQQRFCFATHSHEIGYRKPLKSSYIVTFKPDRDNKSISDPGIKA